MIIEKTKLEGVLLIKLYAFEDHRGQYIETYNEWIGNSTASSQVWLARYHPYVDYSTG